MKRNIYFNGRFLQQKFSGTQRFAECILKEIDNIIEINKSDTNKYHLVCPKGDLKYIKLKNISIIQAGLGRGHLWEQTSLPLLSRDGLLINLINSGPALHPKQIVTLHDASLYDLPQLFSWKYRYFHRILRSIISRRAKFIITVSPFSRKRFRDIYNADDKTIVIPNGCDHVDRAGCDDTILDTKGLQKNRYILCVGNASKNKNLISAYQAWTALPIEGMKLVTVGAIDKKVFGNDASLAVEASKNDDVHFLTGVTDEQLVALYRNAAVFLFPSLYEGFGIPPLEAMRLGCPVVATNAAAVPDTVGDAAILVDPRDVSSISEALLRVLSDDAIRDEIIERGHKRAEAFTWSKSGELLYRLIAQLS